MQVIDLDLRRVRRELDQLAEARLVEPLGRDRQARYESLCRLERELLGA